MITAIVLVCLYADPTKCGVVKSDIFYPSMETCYADRVNAERHLGTTTQGVVSYYCHNWGDPA